MGARKEFLPEIDRLRGFAILLIVLSHATFSSRHSTFGHATWATLAGGTWPFVFISGYLTAHLSANTSILSYWRKKFVNVVIPYFVIVSTALAVGLKRNDANLWEYYLLGWPAAGPLWFIPMILLFFAAFPLYRYLIRRPIVVLFAAATFAALSITTGRTQFDDGPHLNFIVFQAPFLMGMACCLYRDQFDRFMINFFPIVILLLMVGAVLATGENIARFEMLPMMALTAILVIALKRESLLNKYWEWLAQRSFGIFFIHGFFTDLQRQTLGDDLPLWLTLPFGIALLIGTGLLVDLVGKFAGKRSRLIVGV